MDSLDPDACYLALKARDNRFDGVFFTGVTSTGIYCRPVCRVRTPKADNCRFFGHAAQAEAAGFRPCLRCRPELAPASGNHVAAWSTEDASQLLALDAARLLRDAADGHTEAGSVAQVAQRLGVSERHLRRIFTAHWGTSPLQYVQTLRLLSAKLLLTDTRLPVSTVAALSGFASQRRFHAAWHERYGLNPLQLRLRPGTGTATAGDTSGGFQFKLAYRPPLDVAHLLSFLGQRAMVGVEWVDMAQAQWGSTLTVRQGTQTHAGWVMARFDARQPLVHLQVADGLAPVLRQVLQRVRHVLDLDLQPDRVHAVLHATFPDAAGQRLPGALDGFAQAVRAVLGQQITVKAARTLAQRLVKRWGTPIVTPWPGLTHLFPAPEVLALTSEQDLGEQGITRQRQAAIRALALGVASGSLQLDTAAPPAATMAALKALPGIGDWTAHYIAMRALHWPDAFPAGDVALHHALGLSHLGLREATREAERRAQAWRPWRAYAVVRAWHTAALAPKETP
ncbi:MAG: Ada metal-binding domain-containing protein [Hydrogenophaga sp.]|nr:Ada metal-binding domain-containing protein [Hydrogenophaga sp.]